MNLAQSLGIDEPKTTLTACFLTVLLFLAGYDCALGAIEMVNLIKQL